MPTLGTVVELVAVFDSTPNTPRAHVKRPSGAVDTVTLTASSGSYVGAYTTTERGTHTWTVDTADARPVANAERAFDVVARNATPEA
jgi:hypothetical protein